MRIKRLEGSNGFKVKKKVMKLIHQQMISNVIKRETCHNIEQNNHHP